MMVFLQFVLQKISKSVSYLVGERYDFTVISKVHAPILVREPRQSAKA